MTKQKIALLLTVSIYSSYSFGAARFAGGMCHSQGTWIQAALQQSDVVVNAINALRNDESCKVLVDALDKAPKYQRSKDDTEEGSSFANVYSELSAISEAIKPVTRYSADPKMTAYNSAAAMQNTSFRNVVFNLVFNKSFESVKAVNAQDNLPLTNADQERAKSISLRLKSFVKRSKDIAEMTMSTGKSILAALPESKLCLHNRPSSTAAIFGAVAHAAASLTSGGELSGVGEFISAILKYNRDISYINNLVEVEKIRFQTSVSCLLESSAESYCAAQDAEDSLDYFKNLGLSETQKDKLDLAVANAGKDPVANPLGGLILLMRDIPVLQGWMQRVLFG
ncbi:MAG: hypothetical protein AB7H97_18590, partial [Pseudobdellovibrionaceae bacterium]